MTTSMDDPVAMVSVAVGVLTVAVMLALGWRRSRALGSDGGRIELVTSRYLGSKRVLTLVDVEGERLLLALSGNTVRLVARINSRPRRRSRADSWTRAGSTPARAGRDSRLAQTSQSEIASTEAFGAEPCAVPAREGART